MKMLILLAAAALIIPLHGANLDEANASFAAGKFHDSTVAYQAVLEQKGYSAPVLFDLGNSQFREGDYPGAILAYKRALWLSPGDEDILANLQAAQKEAGTPVEQPSGLTRLAGMWSANGWAWLACAAWTLLCASLLLRAILPRQRMLFSVAGAVCALVVAGAIGAIALSAPGLREAVVVDKNATLLIAPFPAAQTVFSPAPGAVVKIQKAHNDFLRISDGAGHSGWIAKEQLAPVVPG